MVYVYVRDNFYCCKRQTQKYTSASRLWPACVSRSKYIPVRQLLKIEMTNGVVTMEILYDIIWIWYTVRGRNNVVSYLQSPKKNNINPYEVPFLEENVIYVLPLSL